MKESRLFWFDNAKIFLIFCVIMGHVIARIGEGEFGKTLDSSLYFFHMPLFIFISGLFTKKRGIKRNIMSILKLLEAYFVFEIIHILIRFFLFKDRTPFLWLLLIPQWSLWYLLSLAFWRSFVFFIKWDLSSYKFVLYSIVLGLLVGFVPIESSLSFQRTFSLFPFFAMGYYFRQKRFNFNMIRKLPISMAIVVLVSLFCVSYFSSFPLKQFNEGLYSYYYFDFSLVIAMGCRCMMYLVCILASVCVLRLIPVRYIIFFSNEGSHTLLYYLYHTSLIYFLISLKPILSLPSSFCACVIYTLIICLFIWLIIQMPFFRVLPNCISNSFERINQKREDR